MVSGAAREEVDVVGKAVGCEYCRLPVPNGGAWEGTGEGGAEKPRERPDHRPGPQKGEEIPGDTTSHPGHSPQLIANALVSQPLFVSFVPLHRKWFFEHLLSPNSHHKIQPIPLSGVHFSAGASWPHMPPPLPPHQPNPWPRGHSCSAQLDQLNISATGHEPSTESLQLIQNVPLQLSPNSSCTGAECCLEFIQCTIKCLLAWKMIGFRSLAPSPAARFHYGSGIGPQVVPA